MAEDAFVYFDRMDFFYEGSGPEGSEDTRRIFKKLEATLESELGHNDNPFNNFDWARFRTLYKRYYDLRHSFAEFDSHTSTQSEKKDPHLAGAVGTAVGGPAFGVYSAMSADIKNAQLAESQRQKRESRESDERIIAYGREKLDEAFRELQEVYQPFDMEVCCAIQKSTTAANLLNEGIGGTSTKKKEEEKKKKEAEEEERRRKEAASRASMGIILGLGMILMGFFMLVSMMMSC